MIAINLYPFSLNSDIKSSVTFGSVKYIGIPNISAITPATKESG